MRHSSPTVFNAFGPPSVGQRWRAPIYLCIAFASGFVLALVTSRRTGLATVGVHLANPDSYLPVSLDTAGVKAAKDSLKRFSDSYTVVSETVVYSRFARMYNRVIRHPGTRGTFGYDILGRVWRNDSFAVVSVIPFDTKTGTFTMLKEYNFAHARAVFTFPQGCYQPTKHTSPRTAVLSELNEEAGLGCRDDALVDLLDSTEGSPQDKYQREVVHYYLCTSTIPLANGLRQGQDLEEHIIVERHVSVSELKAFVRLGMLQSNNIAGALLAIDKLKELGLLALGA